MSNSGQRFMHKPDILHDLSQVMHRRLLSMTFFFFTGILTSLNGLLIKSNGEGKRGCRTFITGMREEGVRRGA